jgi:hypothetical protein
VQRSFSLRRLLRLLDSVRGRLLLRLGLNDLGAILDRFRVPVRGRIAEGDRQCAGTGCGEGTLYDLLKESKIFLNSVI